ncbi:hypothetical protein Bca4012_058574 [Brassica carinata]|uniref:Uncharacterized protein n=1 Tax=Brassica carinata TaxID=52824 RepID=A0A8X8B3Z2_BRACI|nr:hypothetical protein Bca52824_016307 [Brassica carinata]
MKVETEEQNKRGTERGKAFIKGFGFEKPGGDKVGENQECLREGLLIESGNGKEISIGDDERVIEGGTNRGRGAEGGIKGSVTTLDWEEGGSGIEGGPETSATEFGGAEAVEGFFTG